MGISPGDILGGAASATAVVAAGIALARWGRAKVREPSPFVIRRVTKPDDPDLDAALELYHGRFRDLPVEMDDVSILRASITEDADDAEYLFVAKYHEQVVAMLFGSFCRIDQLFFVWYVAGFRGDPTLGFVHPKPGEERPYALAAAFQGILRALFDQRQLRDCHRAVAEISNHWFASKASLFADWASRNAGRLYKIDLPYRQPLLTFPSNEVEQPMTLVLAELPPEPGTRLSRIFSRPERPSPPPYRETLARAEAAEIVGCLYSHMYGARETTEEWAAYIQAERSRLFEHIGDGVRLESVNARRARG
ncbi:MAG: hypothetical protein U0360_04975 [Dehalococcoidia bacterium]